MLDERFLAWEECRKIKDQDEVEDEESFGVSDSVGVASSGSRLRN